jgi:hypothetical protein
VGGKKQGVGKEGTGSAKDPKVTKAEFLREAEKAYEMMFAEKEQPKLVTFAQREARAVEAMKLVGKWLIERHLGDDEAASVPAIGLPCPFCGEPVEKFTAAERIERRIESRTGAVDFEREGALCRRCRRRFFPPRRASLPRD